MRTRNALERLAAAAPAVELPVDADEDRILARILASPRPARRQVPRLRTAFALVAAIAVAAGVVLATLSHRSTGLSGARIRLAGYTFTTPAGFARSSSSCGSANDFNGFAAAASGDGGCLEAFVMFSSRGSVIPAGADPVTVGAYQGYLLSAPGSRQATLYVVLPARGGFVKSQALVLDSQGLSEDQLVAIAESGLPQNPQAASTIGPT